MKRLAKLWRGMASDDFPRLLLDEWITFRKTTQKAVAEKVRMSKGRMSDLSQGKERWNATHLKVFAKALDCEPWELIARDPNLPEREDVVALIGATKDIDPKDRPDAIAAALSVLQTFARRKRA